MNSELIIKILILCLFLIGCNSKKCPKPYYRKYLYGDKIRVRIGFYKGSSGTIVQRVFMYDSRTNCSVNGFIVKICKDSIGCENVRISQYDLWKD